MNYIELGPVPACEECAQAGADNYEQTARRECLVFRRMLSRLFPVPDGLDARYMTRRYPHEQRAIGTSGRQAPCGAFGGQPALTSTSQDDAIARAVPSPAFDMNTQFDSASARSPVCDEASPGHSWRGAYEPGLPWTFRHRSST